MKIKDNYEFDTHTRMISISHFNIKLWSWSEYGAKFKRINNNILYNQLQFSNQKLNLEKMSEFSNWCYRLQIVWRRACFCCHDRGMKSVTCITGVGLCHVMKCISVIGCEAVIVERPLV